MSRPNAVSSRSSAVKGRFTTEEQRDAYGAYETGFLLSSPYYDTRVVADAEQLIS